MKKLKEFFKSQQGKRVAYEVKSFIVTFVGVYISIIGITETTTIQEIVSMKDLLIGSLGIAASRTILIYITSFTGIRYRDNTLRYK